MLGLLEQKKGGQTSVDINCKGVNKANLGWTPLHLAAYFGHTQVVNVLLEVCGSIAKPGLVFTKGIKLKLSQKLAQILV